ncbi:MAG: S41 family peptidase [Spirochaetes bacterium]|nr:S41 family peptidase [Spirochaetota bacterium]
MKNRERIVWMVVVAVLLVVTTASGINNWLQAGNTEKTYANLRLFNEVFNLIRTEYYDEAKVQPEQLIPGAIDGMIGTLGDPHTSYFSKEHFDELKTDTRGEFGGLGIVIGLRDKWITVISPIDDTPAFRAGVLAGDRIVEIDGEPTEGFTTMDAVKLLRGEVGTQVTITVQRRSKTKPITFTITRGVIKLETVKSTVIDEEIGYIRISQFSEPTAEAMREHISALKKKGARSMIVDLRNNPGGLLGSAIEISDMFLDKGIIVSTKGRDPSQNQEFKAHGGAEVSDIPLIVMVNEGSASGSEIFAGAIKDNKRGLLVGGKTFGKGSVQTVRELPEGAGIRITTALYYTPSGVSIHEQGIMPDEEVKAVEITPEELEAMEKLEDLEMVQTFVKDHGTYTESDLDAFIGELAKNEMEIRPIIIRRLIKNEQEKLQIPDLIDLDYDLQLNHAVNMLKSSDAIGKSKAS